jgi:hypothetical protein
MKPRGNKEVKPQEEMNSMAEQSTVEGQQEAVKEAVLDGQEGNETPGNLEPENGEEKFQNLESSLADDEGLQAALNESGDEVIDAEFAEVEEPQTAKPSIEALQAAYGTASFPDPPQILGIGTLSPEQIEAIRESVDSSGKLIWRPLEPAIGPQPDGSEKFIITVQEGYTDAVRQWAEADGVPVERWLSDRLYEYISTYGEPAKGR